jgi:hypothetical protein
LKKGDHAAFEKIFERYSKRWSDAATTYRSIIDDAERPYNLFPNYQTMFFQENENNREVIMAVQFKYPELLYHGNVQCLPGSQNGWGAGNPTQDLVDQFDLLDGKSWNDPSSEFYNPSNPYANRDKRFYATIQHD